MSQKRRRIPSYRLHKPSGQARVIIDGEHVYLGKYGSPESWEKYHRQVAEHLSQRQPAPRSEPQAYAGIEALAVDELILRYWTHARSYYVKGGRATDEQAGIRSSLRFLRRHYGRTPVSEFGPLKLKTVRDAMVRSELSRRVVNKYVQRIRRMFRWGVENELVPVEVYQALMTVAGLRKGRTGARETEPVKPVPDEYVDATLPFLTEVVRSMVQFQRLTGCRPEDVCKLRPGDVNMSGEIWCYVPNSHKMQHVRPERRVYIGPRAQEVLQPWLQRPSDVYCFSPKEAAQASRTERRRRRRTPITPSQSKREMKLRPKRAPGNQYTRHSYNQAIWRACKRAGVPKWTPNQLRHSRGTEVREEYGLEASQTVLGHARADVTQLYAARNEELARRIVLKSG